VFIVFQMEQVPMRWRATMAAAGTMAVGLSMSAVAFGGGYVIAALGYRELFLLGAATTTAGALLFGAAFVRSRPPQSSAPEAQPALGNGVLEPNS
jgi:predicted MFS family arabinose efflux permease